MIDTHRRELTRLIKKEGDLRTELHRHESDASKAVEAARRHEDQARRASSPSSATSALNSAKRERDKALQASKKAADVAKKIGDNARDLETRRRSLETAEKTQRQAVEREEQRRIQKEKSDRQAQEREEQRRVQKEKSERQTRDREDERRRQREKAHAREVAQLSAPQVHYVHIRPPEPEQLRVLYLTANAGADLRTDAEVRSVQQALRGAKLRDLVDVKQRPAATFQDLLDGLNDERPHVVHFSGHGGNRTLLMEDGALENAGGAEVSFELLAKAVGATDSPPILLVLNACDTLGGADLILPAVPVVIAMADEVLDIAAIIFAQQFYAALASGQSVGSALAQAKVAIEAAVLEAGAENLPTCISRADVDIHQLILVKAPTDSGERTL
jgi:hypothetical protein